MKINRINTLARLCGMTLAVALFAGIAGMANAQEKGSAKGGATKLMEVTGRAATAKADPSNYTPMSCPKCKNDFVRRVDWTARGASKPVVAVVRHLCGGCENDLVVSGHGKAKITTTVHTCNSCGAENLACCSASKSGIISTKGMEKKFEVAPVK